MKYFLIFGFLAAGCSVHDLCAMEGQDKAKQLHKLRAMNEAYVYLPQAVRRAKEDVADKKVESHKNNTIPEPCAHPKKPLPPVPTDPIAEHLDLMQEYANRQFAKLHDDYENALNLLLEQSDQQDIRMARILNRQCDTITHMSDLIKQLILKGGKLEKRMGVQADDLEELRDDSDQHIGRLMDAIGDQSEMFVKQNAVIRELMVRVDKLTQKAVDQARRQALQSMALAKVRIMVEELSKKETMRDVEDLLAHFIKEMPVVESDGSDQEIYNQVFGTENSKDKGEASAAHPALAADYEHFSKQFHLPLASDEEEEYFIMDLERETTSSKLLREELPEDEKDRVRTSEQEAPRGCSSEEIISDITFVEDFVRESNYDEEGE